MLGKKNIINEWKNMKRLWNKIVYWWTIHFNISKFILLKTTWKGVPWDWAALLELEQAKFKEMAIYFEKSKLASDWEFQVRDCKLCIKLIDIILEQDEPYNQWLETNYSLYRDKGLSVRDALQVPISTYVNIRNAYRFVDDLDFDKSDSCASNLFEVDLRQIKAFYLYQKIRLYKLQNLWD